MITEMCANSMDNIDVGNLENIKPIQGIRKSCGCSKINEFWCPRARKSWEFVIEV
jgi:hypothetical protein